MKKKPKLVRVVEATKGPKGELYCLAMRALTKRDPMSRTKSCEKALEIIRKELKELEYSTEDLVNEKPVLKEELFENRAMKQKELSERLVGLAGAYTLLGIDDKLLERYKTFRTLLIILENLYPEEKVKIRWKIEWR